MRTADIVFGDHERLALQLKQLRPSSPSNHYALLEFNSDRGETLAFVANNFVRYETVAEFE
jgi:hypothetical protein